MLSIELDIYSGRSNPTWILSPREEAELVERVLADPTLMQPVSAEMGGLGYRGFIVSALNENAEVENSAVNKARLRAVSGEMVKFPSQFRLGSAVDASASTSQWLLATSEKQHTEVDDYLRAYAQQSIISSSPTIEEKAHRATPPPQAKTEGMFIRCGNYNLTSNSDFSFWNNVTAIGNNNCYNFSSNYRSNTYAQPGRLATGQNVPHPVRGWDVVNRLRMDGWSDSCLGGATRNIVIALVIASFPNFNDFHFYRMCADGYWCHKAGQTPAKNVDNSGRFIDNPESCDRGLYTEFWGYFYADRYKQVA